MEAKEIIKARKLLNLSQTELAKRMGVSINTIQNWEYGKTIPKTKIPFLKTILKQATYEENNLVRYVEEEITEIEIQRKMDEYRDECREEIEDLKNQIRLLQKVVLK
jgi:putative transcriptional regulator